MKQLSMVCPACHVISDMPGGVSTRSLAHYALFYFSPPFFSLIFFVLLSSYSSISSLPFFSFHGTFRLPCEMKNLTPYVESEVRKNIDRAYCFCAGNRTQVLQDFSILLKRSPRKLSSPCVPLSLKVMKSEDAC